MSHQPLAFDHLHLGDDRPKTIHRGAAAVAAYDFERCFAAILAAKVDGLLQLTELVVGEAADLCQAPVLLGGFEQLLQSDQLGAQASFGLIEGAQIALAASQEKATLAGLGVLQRRQHALELL